METNKVTGEQFLELIKKGESYWCITVTSPVTIMTKDVNGSDNSHGYLGNIIFQEKLIIEADVLSGKYEWQGIVLKKGIEIIPSQQQLKNRPYEKPNGLRL